MQLHDLRPAEGSTKKRKRVGRGTGSGKGKTSTRGTKGQNSRSGGGTRPTHEGGQLPLVKRLPKLRGISKRGSNKNIFKVFYTAVNLDALERLFDNDAYVTPESLVSAGLVGSPKQHVVVLARGDVAKPLHIKAHRVSEAARQKIEAVGGSVELLPVTINKHMPRS
ncbi:MAG: 50S ribosomal protein L15 [Chloroflexota bacterium]|nr:50S ribosomal protein L15 [Chloroflexota bacterium]